MNTTERLAGILASCTILLAAATSHAENMADFYRGKTVRLIVGSSASGSYGLVGRALATHMGQHIPGKPTIVVEYMPGASSLIMSNYLYNAAPRDGTVIGMPSSSLPLEPRLHILSHSGGEMKFDITRFNWLGTAVQEPQIFWTLSNSPYRSIEDLKTNEFVAGADGPGAEAYTLPTIMNNVFHTRIKIVTGYDSPASFFPAAEKGELNGSISALSEIFHRNNVRVLLQFGAERSVALKNVPTAIELAPTEADRKMLEFYAIKFKMARSFTLPPEVPADRVEAMRTAFDDTVKDSAFVDDAKKLGFEVVPIDGPGIMKLMQEVADAPQPLVDRLRKIIEPIGAK
jgi:tripartite-type tricarboxylate transporter receptor subunit TctC